MNLLTSLTIGRRLALGFAAMLVLTLTLGLVALNRLAVVNAAAEDLATNWLVATRLLSQFAMNENEIRRVQARFAMSPDAATRRTEAARVQSLQAKSDEAWGRYMATVETDEEREIAAAVVAARQGYDQALGETLKLASSDDGDDRIRVAAEESYRVAGAAAFQKLMDATRKDIDFQNVGGDRAFAAAQQTYHATRTFVIALLAGALAIGALLAWRIARTVVEPLREAVRVAERVESGDLTARVEATGADETAQLLRALGRMNEGLVRIVGDVRQSAESIATGSSQIATGNTDLSQRTEEQASNLQETAASMEQLTATVQHNAAAASQMRQLSQTATGSAERGAQVVVDVVQTMGRIAESSRRIGDIIGVIDGIAFQTNILALNAAVEAARAGEQGRGFAVVAAEVRTLAGRSAEAAREIKSLIGESTVRVEQGSTLAGQAGSVIEEILSHVRRVDDLVGEISASSQEQSQGIGQVGDAVQQLDQVTQQNAALVEESAAAAESLRQQASQLNDTVQRFQLPA